MCGHHHHERGERGHGHRGFGRRGFPNREQLVGRLQGYQQHLEQELANTRELLDRLADVSGGTDQPAEI